MIRSDERQRQNAGLSVASLLRDALASAPSFHFFSVRRRTGHNPERHGPGLLVMSPTRELAQQTEQEAERFGACIGFNVVMASGLQSTLECVSKVAMYGGAPKNDQMRKCSSKGLPIASHFRYRYGVHTIVACRAYRSMRAFNPRVPSDRGCKCRTDLVRQVRV